MSTFTECHLPLETLYLIYDHSDYITWLNISSLNHHLLAHYNGFRRRYNNRYTKYTIKKINKKIEEQKNKHYKKNWVYREVLKLRNTDDNFDGDKNMFAYLASRLNHDSEWYKTRYDNCKNGYKIGNLKLPMYICFTSIEIIKLNTDHMYANCLYNRDNHDISGEIAIFDKLKKVDQLCNKKIVDNKGNLKIKVKGEIKANNFGSYMKESYMYNDIDLYEGGRGYEGMWVCIIPVYKNNKLDTLDIELTTMHYYMS
jgi:hypothetical protein